MNFSSYSYERASQTSAYYERIPPIKRVPGQPKTVQWDHKLGRHVIYRATNSF